MARREVAEEGSRKRERLATLLLVLFPLLATMGFLAPGFVRSLAVAQENDPGVRDVVVDRLGPYAHRPLMVPRSFSDGVVPELLDLDQLFVRAKFRIDPRGDQLARVSAFDRSFGDSIVRDSVGKVVAEVVFKDALMSELPKTLIAAFDIEGTSLGLCGSTPAANCIRDDDLTNTDVVVTLPVPEPGTSSMLALGLLGLAFCARRY